MEILTNRETMRTAFLCLPVSQVKSVWIAITPSKSYFTSVHDYFFPLRNCLRCTHAASVKIPEFIPLSCSDGKFSS